MRLLRKKRSLYTAQLSKGYKQEDAETVYDYIEKFANYGFNKSHAVAYAMLSYQLAYLKSKLSNGILYGIVPKCECEVSEVTRLSC